MARQSKQLSDEAREVKQALSRLARGKPLSGSPLLSLTIVKARLSQSGDPDSRVYQARAIHQLLGEIALDELVKRGGAPVFQDRAAIAKQRASVGISAVAQGTDPDLEAWCYLYYRYLHDPKLTNLDIVRILQRAAGPQSPGNPAAGDAIKKAAMAAKRMVDRRTELGVTRLTDALYAMEHQHIAALRSQSTPTQLPAQIPTAAPARLSATPSFNLPHWAGSTSTFVARSTEIAALDEVWKGVKKGRAQAVVVRGETGVGKTRLIQEFVAQQARGGALWLHSEVSELDKDAAYYALANAIRRVLEGGAPRPGLRDALADLDDALPGFNILRRSPRPLISRIDPEETRRQRHRAGVRVLLELTRLAPLILYFDDLQWTDQASLACVHTVLMQYPHQKLMFCGTVRAEPESVPLGESLHRWMSDLEQRRDCLKLIDLPRLTDGETQRLVDAELGSTKASPDVRAWVFRHSDGNPLYALGILAVLRDKQMNLHDPSQVLPVNDELFTVPLHLPFVYSIMSRLLKLGKFSKAFVDASAVIGREFDGELARRISGLDLEQASQAINDLKAHSLIEQRDHDLGLTYDFTHQLCRDIVYQNIDDFTRRDLHRQVAHALEASTDEPRTERDVQDLARHYWKGELWDDALRYQLRVAKEALSALNLETARGFFATAQRIFDRDPKRVPRESRLAYLIGLGDMHRYLGELVPAQERYHQAADLMSAVGEGGPAFADLCRKLAVTYERQTDFKQARDWLDRARAITSVSDDPMRFARICLQYGMICVRQRDLAQAEEWATLACEVESAQAYNLRSIVCRERHALDEALVWCTRSIETAERAKNPFSLAKAHTSRSVILFDLGRWEEAIKANENALRLQTENGDAYMSAITRCNLSDQYRHRGKLAEAKRHALAGLEVSEHVGSDFERALARQNLGAMWLALGNPARGRAELELARDLLVKRGVKDQLAEVERWMAEALLMEGRLPEALAAAETACEVAREMAAAEGRGSTPALGSALRVLGAVHSRMARDQSSAGGDETIDHEAEAERVLHESRDMLGTSGPRYELGRTLLVLAELYADRRGRRAEAGRALADARLIFDELGAALDARAAEALAARLMGAPGGNVAGA